MISGGARNWSIQDPRRQAKEPLSVSAGERGVQVLQVVLSLNPGGTERLVIDLSQQLSPRHGMHVCCLDEPGEWADELRATGVSVSALGRRPGFSPSLGWRLARVAAQHGATVLHCHHYSPYVYGTLARFWRPLEIVFTEHGRANDAQPSSKRQWANKLLSRVPARTFVVSENLRTHLAAEGFPQDRVEVIRNGIRPGPTPDARARAEARERLHASPDQLLIGSVGRLDPVKDLGTLLEAFRRIAVFNPEARLVLIGDGPERSTLEKAAAAKGLSSLVSFAGYRTDTRALLPGLDIFVNSSIFEGISLTILEAMAAVLPVIATRAGGTPEVVVHGQTGWVVPTRDAGAIAASLSELLGDSMLRRAMGLAGRRRVEQMFSLERMVDRYAAVYREFEVA